MDGRAADGGAYPSDYISSVCATAFLAMYGVDGADERQRRAGVAPPSTLTIMGAAVAERPGTPSWVFDETADQIRSCGAAERGQSLRAAPGRRDRSDSRSRATLGAAMRGALVSRR